MHDDDDWWAVPTSGWTPPVELEAQGDDVDDREWWERPTGAYLVGCVTGFLLVAAVVACAVRRDGTYLMAVGAALVANGMALANLRDAWARDDEARR